MKQLGQASVVGIDGTVAIDGATALGVMIESIDTESRATVEEFISGLGELIGLRVSDEREYIDLVLVPKVTAAAGSLDDAKESLAPLPIPAKVTLASVPDSAGNHIALNTDYIYVGGARRTLIRGQAAYRITAFKPKTSPLTVAQILTLAA